MKGAILQVELDLGIASFRWHLSSPTHSENQIIVGVSGVDRRVGGAREGRWDLNEIGSGGRRVSKAEHFGAFASGVKSLLDVGFRG